MSLVIITVGVPASGKTTWAKEYIKTHTDTVISCRDEIRAGENLPYGDPKIERVITKIQHDDIESAIESGLDVIVADTNIVEMFRIDLIEFCLDLGATVQIVTFPISLREACERDSKRESPVGLGVIARFQRMLTNSPPVEDCVITKDDWYRL